MKKIILKSTKTIKKYDNKLPLHFQGWLMDNIEPDLASKWHRNGLKPYSIYVSEGNNEVHFEINLFNSESIVPIEKILLNEELNELKFNSSFQEKYIIDDKELISIRKKDLSDIFYRSESNNEFTIKFLSATSFKSNGEYLMFPDINLILKSLMRRYNYVFENSNEIDWDLFNELVSKTKIVSYRTFSSYHPIHKVYIPGFKGDIKIRCNGNQTIVNYLAMLIKFSNYSGIGIKNTMGMGSVRAREVVKGVKHG